jgi:uncharacterized Ntn-hydrolase superfamily protein
MTFSIAARCMETGVFGVAVCSSSPAVAARCAFVRAGVGAALSQNITDPALGPQLLDRLAGGYSAADAIEDVAGSADWIEFRQLLVIGGSGPPASRSGDHTLGVHATAASSHAVAGGNLLASRQVPGAIVAAFEAAHGALGDRILTAMRAGLTGGGEAGAVHSAGMLLAGEVSWPIADLRVDWTEGDPIAELAALWMRYAPQIDDYVKRAIDPRQAPSYGVPGDR